MIRISKEEADALRAKFGASCELSITNKTKKGGRKKYYMPEEYKFLGFLRRYRTGAGRIQKGAHNG